MDVASSATTDIGNGYGPVVKITGNNAITSFGAHYVGAIFLRFADVLTLTHSASLVLPGAANITTVAGDACIAVPIGSPASGWRILSYCRMSLTLLDDVAVRTSSTYADPAWLTALAWSKITGKPTTISGYGITDAPTKTGTGASGSWGIDITGWAKSAGAGADIASAATLPLAARTGNIVRVTGTTAVTATDLENGGAVFIFPTAALPLTYHATNMPVQGGASYTCSVGDMVIMHRDGNGTLHVFVEKFSGYPMGGKTVAQIQTYATAAVATGTTTIPYDDTIPQNTEGDQYLSVAITPVNANSLLEISFELIITSTQGVGNALIAALFQDSTANALKATFELMEAGNGFVHVLKMTHYMTAGTTSATTFKVRAGGSSAGTATVNGSASARLMGGVAASQIAVKEYLP